MVHCQSCLTWKCIVYISYTLSVKKQYMVLLFIFMQILYSAVIFVPDSFILGDYVFGLYACVNHLCCPVWALGLGAL